MDDFHIAQAQHTLHAVTFWAAAFVCDAGSLNSCDMDHVLLF